MKMIPALKTTLAICLLAASTASSASVWAPNDGDSNFLSFNTSSFIFPALSDTYGIFEDTVNIATAVPVVTFSGVGAVSFSAIGADFNVSNGVTTGTLQGSNHFQIGLLSDNVWNASFGNVDLNSDATLLMFADSSTFNNLHYLYAFDITPVISEQPIAPVPLPSAVWLMTSAIMSLLALGRRKSSISA